MQRRRIQAPKSGYQYRRLLASRPFDSILNVLLGDVALFEARPCLLAEFVVVLVDWKVGSVPVGEVIEASEGGGERFECVGL